MNSHRKGSRWRRQVQTWLDELGFVTRFRSLGEAGDDIAADNGVLWLSIEAKNTRAHDLAGWIDQAEGNAVGLQLPVVIAHRRGHVSVDDGYAVMSCRTLAKLLTQVHTVTDEQG